ncbi:MAG: class I SAM-dependent DNA methyltransferase [Bacteroidales bacterium]|nr:class I SAM-dependent DNA methyltransferase [Bacteroidales bacterium]
MKSEKQQAAAAADFAKRWEGRGYEKGESQVFWTELLTEVFGIEKPSSFLTFEQQAQLDHTSFIDVMIPSTHVMIEQKSIDKDPNKPIRQSDGTLLTPFQQAQRYSAVLPYSQRPRWIVICNFKEFAVHDMENPNGEPHIIYLKDLGREYYRLKFLVEQGNEHLQKEMEVSMKAGEIVGKLYDALIKQYIDPTKPSSMRSLNILCVRLVFCLYAEDAGIFGKHDMFHDYLVQFDTDTMRAELIRLFQVLNTRPEDRDPYLRSDLAAFPYANGGLFAEDIEIPRFNDEIRTLLLQHASLDFDWSMISPTIFGAVFESTLNPETRRSGGMHYTSIENIHKVIDPLFLDDLNKEFETIMEENVIKTRNKKLLAFQDKLASLTFFDPACGSGNFLTETYLSLRRLENKVLRQLYGSQVVIGAFIIRVSIQQFYGIEINDFAVTVATTALWISEAQMLAETEKIIQQDLDFLPLKSYTNIHEGNALRTDWESVVPKDKLNYIIGNPPFVGQAMRTKEQTEDLKLVFAPSKDYGKLDYVTGWFKKAADLMKGTEAEAAFVSSNSICQGEMVNLFWQKLLTNGIYINFAVTTFLWTSEAKSKAAVMCVIAGFSYNERKEKQLFTGENYVLVDHINGYLKAAPDVYITNRSKSINEGLAKVVQGSPPADDGRLLFSKDERIEMVRKYPELDDVLLPFVGSKEFINNIGFTRYCLWLVGKRPSDYSHISELTERFEYIREYRLKSPVDRIQKTADKPYLFTQNRQPETDYLFIPRVSSSTRRYIPVGFMPPTVIASDAAVLVNNASIYDFGLISSNVHNAWMRVVAGRLKNDYRYAPSVYYNFPMPKPTDEQRAIIENTAQAIINARKHYSDKCLADMYGEQMYLYPELLEAHRENDRAVMDAYGFSTKMTESECVAALFNLYSTLASRNK